MRHNEAPAALRGHLRHQQHHHRQASSAAHLQVNSKGTARQSSSRRWLRRCKHICGPHSDSCMQHLSCSLTWKPRHTLTTTSRPSNTPCLHAGCSSIAGSRSMSHTCTSCSCRTHLLCTQYKLQQQCRAAPTSKFCLQQPAPTWLAAYTNWLKLRCTWPVRCGSNAPNVRAAVCRNRQERMYSSSDRLQRAAAGHQSVSDKRCYQALGNLGRAKIALL